MIQNLVSLTCYTHRLQLGFCLENKIAKVNQGIDKQSKSTLRGDSYMFDTHTFTVQMLPELSRSDGIQRIETGVINNY